MPGSFLSYFWKEDAQAKSLDLEMKPTSNDVASAFDALSAFLAQFKYTDENGKRIGLLLFSSNNKLTTYLEKKSAKIIKETEKIAKTEQPDIEIVNVFLDFIEKSLMDVRSRRFYFGDIERVFVPLPSNGNVIREKCTEYRVPYYAGKFESNLITGLSAMRSYVTDTQKEKIKAIIDLAETPQHKKIIEVSVHSFTATSDNYPTLFLGSGYVHGP